MVVNASDKVFCHAFFVGDEGVGIKTLLYSYLMHRFVPEEELENMNLYPMHQYGIEAENPLSGELGITHFMINSFEGMDPDNPRTWTGYHPIFYDVFVVCFAVNCPQSLRSAVDSWTSKIDYHNPSRGGVKHVKVLLGLKADLRDKTLTDKPEAKEYYCEETKLVKKVRDILQCWSVTFGGNDFSREFMAFVDFRPYAVVTEDEIKQAVEKGGFDYFEEISVWNTYCNDANKSTKVEEFMKKVVTLSHARFNTWYKRLCIALS